MKLESLCVQDIMSHDTFHVYPTTRIDDCAEQLARHKLSGAPVTDQYDHVIGFVSEQDLLEPLSQAVYYCHQPKNVESVMRSNVLTVTPTMQVMQIAKLMMEDKPKIFPVVEEGRLVGVITRRLVTQALLQGQKQCVPV